MGFQDWKEPQLPLWDPSLQLKVSQQGAWWHHCLHVTCWIQEGKINSEETDNAYLLCSWARIFKTPACCDFSLYLSISVRWCLCNYCRLWSPWVMGCCAQRTFCTFSFGLREKCFLLLCACTVLLLLFCLIAPCLFSWAFFLGNKSYSGSTQSLTSIGSKETPKVPPNPDLPPKMCSRLRLDTASSNGYQRPGSV